MKSGRKIDIYETEKSQIACGQIYLNVYMFRNHMKLDRGKFYIGIL